MKLSMYLQLCFSIIVFSFINSGLCKNIETTSKNIKFIKQFISVQV